MKYFIKLLALTAIIATFNFNQANASGTTNCYHGNSSNPFQIVYAVVYNGICPAYVHPEPEPEPEPAINPLTGSPYPVSNEHIEGSAECRLAQANPFQ